MSISIEESTTSLSWEQAKQKASANPNLFPHLVTVLNETSGLNLFYKSSFTILSAGFTAANFGLAYLNRDRVFGVCAGTLSAPVTVCSTLRLRNAFYLKLEISRDANTNDRPVLASILKKDLEKAKIIREKIHLFMQSRRLDIESGIDPVTFQKSPLIKNYGTLEQIDLLINNLESYIHVKPCPKISVVIEQDEGKDIVLEPSEFVLGDKRFEEQMIQRGQSPEQIALSRVASVLKVSEPNFDDEVDELDDFNDLEGKAINNDLDVDPEDEKVYKSILNV